MGVTRRPSLFKNPRDAGKRMKKNAEQTVINATVQYIQQLNRSVPMNQKLSIQESMPNYLIVTERRAVKHGVVDLKPLFARSPKRKTNSKGQWYLVIPIRRKVSSMSSALYREARAVSIMPTASSATFQATHLYDNRPQSTLAQINYEPVSNNLTKLRSGNNRSTYVAFRTVGAFSPPNSWIVGRKNVNQEDMSKTLIRNIDRMIRWKLKHMNE